MFAACRLFPAMRYVSVNVGPIFCPNFWSNHIRMTGYGGERVTCMLCGCACCCRPPHFSPCCGYFVRTTTCGRPSSPRLGAHVGGFEA